MLHTHSEEYHPLYFWTAGLYSTPWAAVPKKISNLGNFIFVLRVVAIHFWRQILRTQSAAHTESLFEQGVVPVTVVVEAVAVVVLVVVLVAVVV